MNKRKRIREWGRIGTGLFAMLLMTTAGYASEKPQSGRWTEERVNQWYAGHDWLVGCNFIPSTAINQLEMWQAETFDVETIDRELKWASELGMNTVRVYLHDLVWRADASGLKERIHTLLDIAAKYRIKPMLVLFDDVWRDNPQLGKQPDPVPGIHNSGWFKGPGTAVVNDTNQWGRLEGYVKDVLTEFGADDRVLLWDLFNEPNTNSAPLVAAAFVWAREINPSQPLTVGVWNRNPTYDEINAFQMDQSDVITFHLYGPAPSIKEWIGYFKKTGRPVICTEWLNRNNPETVFRQLPIFKRENVGCINWGLVSGKTQTMFPWGSPPNAPEPAAWFHDLLHKDGTPFDPREKALFQALTDRREKQP